MSRTLLSANVKRVNLVESWEYNLGMTRVTQYKISFILERKGTLYYRSTRIVFNNLHQVNQIHTIQCSLKLHDANMRFFTVDYKGRKVSDILFDEQRQTNR